ncbi:hypothetical protein B0H12DRAFT_46633 [Mycena haematopus]|nr:hypothetical protein B0H12DRAFT_46633 [Mycena haematopus]
MGRRRSRPNHRGGQLNRDLREQVEQEAQRKAHSPFKQKIKPSVTDTSWKPRDPRRGRSDAALKEHKRKYTTPGGAYDNGQRYWLNQTEMVTKGDSYPRDFVGFAKDAAKSSWFLAHHLHQKRRCSVVLGGSGNGWNVDFGGVITTVECKEGGSEKIHLDWFDNLNIFAWVTAIGDFEGANFCTPQLGGQMVSKPGSLLGARTQLLAHCCTPISGRRIVFTFFVDSCLFEKTMHELN